MHSSHVYKQLASAFRAVRSGNAVQQSCRRVLIAVREEKSEVDESGAVRDEQMVPVKRCPIQDEIVSPLMAREGCGVDSIEDCPERVHSDYADSAAIGSMLEKAVASDHRHRLDCVVGAQRKRFR